LKSYKPLRFFRIFVAFFPFYEKLCRFGKIFWQIPKSGIQYIEDDKQNIGAWRFCPAPYNYDRKGQSCTDAYGASGMVEP